MNLIVAGLLVAVAVGALIWLAGWRRGMNDCRANRGLPPLGKLGRRS